MHECNTLLEHAAMYATSASSMPNRQVHTTASNVYAESVEQEVVELRAELNEVKQNLANPVSSCSKPVCGRVHVPL